MRASKCAPEPNSTNSCPFSIQCAIATKVGMPRSLVTSSTQSRRPVSASWVLQIADIGIVELAEVHFRPLQSIVPPDGVGIPFHQLEESLDDGFLERVAGRAAVGIRVDLVAAGAAVEEIQQAGRKIFEPLVAQRPDRRPFDLGRWIERSRHRRRLVRAIRRREPPPDCASLNSSTSFGRMASPGAKSVNRRVTLISSP